MRMYDIIAKKRDGGTLNHEELSFAVNGYVAGDVPDYQMSALLMAIYLRGMTDEETAMLTDVMAHSGDMVDLSAIAGIKADKHSTGGVGDKTTLVIAPIVAACGVKIAKMSGRGLGHTGGTIDKMEAVPGTRTSLTQEEFFKQVNEIGISVIGQSGKIAVADKKMYALRDVTATVGCIPLIASSIMSKKLAAGSDAILLDVTMGDGAFMKDLDGALELARQMVAIGTAHGRKVAALITDMDKPLGHNIGNALEVAESMAVLQGKGPADLTEVCLQLAANMLVLAGKGTPAECRAMAQAVIADGSAFAKCKEMFAAQGGDTRVLDDYSLFEQPAASFELLAEQDGYIVANDAEKIGSASVLLGAGRQKKGDPLDFAAGITLHKKRGDYVHKGESLATFYGAADKFDAAAAEYRSGLVYGPEKPEEAPLVYALVVSAQQEQIFLLLQLLGVGLGQHPALRRKIDDIWLFSDLLAHRPPTVVNGLTGHQHTHAAAMQPQVGAAVLIGGVVPYLVTVDFQLSRTDPTPDDAAVYHRLAHFGEQRRNVKPHSRPPSHHQKALPAGGSRSHHPPVPAAAPPAEYPVPAAPCHRQSGYGTPGSHPFR